ncbi:MAG: transcription antitermination factor NusB [Solirubrobacterales bacterium]
MSAATDRITPARALAFAVLRRTFEDGAHSERAFRAEAEARELAGRERAQAQRLAYGSVQRRGSTDAAIEELAGRSISQLDPPVLAALRLGLYELLWADAVPDHAVVDQAVELVKAAGAAHAAGFANAILRRAAREREHLLRRFADDSTPAAAAVADSVPEWLARLWWEELGPEAARALLAACNEPAETAFRADDDPAAVLAALRQAGVEAAPAGGGWPLAVAEEIVVSGRTGALAVELVAAGRLTPQSRGSAAVVEVLDPRPGDHVLDLCAGPGIKTGQIAGRLGAGGQVISVELDPERAREVAAQAERLRLHGVAVVEADATALSGLEPRFDRVLLDAPCSDLGALASRPDARWRKSPKTVERLAGVQAAALRQAAALLGPGGTLVYSTCTISRRENEDQVAALLEAAGSGGVPPLVLEDLGALAPSLASPHDSRCLQLRPDRDRTTGFFIARLKRND